MRRYMFALQVAAVAAALVGWVRYDIRHEVRADGITVTWEAVDGKVTEPMLKKFGTKYDKRPGRPLKNAGKGWCEIPAHANGDDKSDTEHPGKVTFHVNVPEAGEYWIWVRTMWPSGCGNSVWVRQEGHPNQLVGKDGTYDKWQWRQAPDKLELQRGVNTIVVANRQDGVYVNELQITTGDVEPAGAVEATDGALAD
jgi:hypothetical protein